jgi:ribosomal protein S18 acetylase RimI-like enzyme
MALQILPYHASDLPALYRICLQTGNFGQDASHLYKDPDLLGHYYVAPYAVSEPDLCFVLAQGSLRCGYILGTRDTEAFHKWCEENWLPHLRKRYSLPDSEDDGPDAHMVRLIHHQQATRKVVTEYPAHLHIDLLPTAQGNGWGQKMMHVFLKRLRELEVRGVHLGVSKKNPRAIRFYEKVGFTALAEFPGGFTYGMRLEC